jgi:NitT/TauT family transport system ATP-binding protein
MKVEVRSKRFGGNEVLSDVAFELPAGQRLAVVGPSGVGKSTLMRIVSGLDTKFDGELEGVGRLAMVFQEPTLLPWRSVLQNVTLPTRCSVEVAERALADVGLAGRGGDFPRQLSLGQQRRLSLARALAAEPELMLLDEAFVSLDEATAERMRSLTLELLKARNLSAILVTHDLAEAVSLAERIIGLSGTPGRMIFDEMVRPEASPDAEVARIRELMAGA